LRLARLTGLNAVDGVIAAVISFFYHLEICSEHHAGGHFVPTKTTCRIGSDVDLLSRINLDEVVELLENSGAGDSVEFITSGTPPRLKDSKTQPGSPERVALLMHGLVEDAFDALVIDATLLPSRLSSGLEIGAVTRRLTPYDGLMCRDEIILDELRENATVAVDGARREAQMLYYRSDLKMVHTRGSLDSLIQKVKSARLDAAVIAAADMERLGKQESVVELLTNSVCVPAAGQGALVVLIRAGDDMFSDTVHRINDAASWRELDAEWAFMNHLGLNCAHPVGVLASAERRALEIEGVLAYPDGREKIHFVVKGLPGQEKDLGRTLAEEILEAGGREILQELHIL
jgi:hydroxymethylbilane synthase